MGGDAENYIFMSDARILCICKHSTLEGRSDMRNITYPESPKIKSFSMCFFVVDVGGPDPDREADLPA